ncbi:MAG: long-chain fatty acid--CoA ligase [Saprospiraceae bacterium]|nr:long-chain fatty acid--CoA ligase [Saprospiraceae bacterium]
MEPTRLFDLIYYQQEHRPLQKAFGQKRESGSWDYLSTDQIVDRAKKLSAGLLDLGVKKGDKIAMAVYKNRPEWVILDIAIQQIGAIDVPVYPTISSREYEFIFKDAGVVYCFVGEGDLYDKVNVLFGRVPSLKGVYTLDPQAGKPYWEDLLIEADEATLEKTKAGVSPDDLATIIYTSGTTGKPKGVMLSHHNILSNMMAVCDIFPITPGDRSLSFLPLCHVFERSAVYLYTYLGVSVSFTGTDELGGEEGDLRAIKPHFFTAVPRLLEKVYEKIYGKGLELSGWKKMLFFWALGLTEEFKFDRSPSLLKKLQIALADQLIYDKWRAALGGCVKGIVVGAAPCPVKILRVFSAAGIPIREGYGLTEASPGICIGLFEPEGAMLGTVGPILDNVTVRIDKSEPWYRDGEGEILACGPNIMLGYYQNPEATDEVIKVEDGQRWLLTGDVGKLVKGPGGKDFLKITDRKKQLLKTSGGKYVAPGPIESKLKENFLIEQVMVVGEQRKFVSALIIPSFETLRNWCQRKGITAESDDELLKKEPVIEKYQSIIDQTNPHFGKVEQVKKFTLLNASWDPVKNDGTEAELTPTLKLKRRVIRSKYEPVIEDLYRE